MNSQSPVGLLGFDEAEELALFRCRKNGGFADDPALHELQKAFGIDQVHALTGNDLGLDVGNENVAALLRSALFASNNGLRSQAENQHEDEQRAEGISRQESARQHCESPLWRINVARKFLVRHAGCQLNFSFCHPAKRFTGLGLHRQR
jgi:hypothetical protein